MHACVHVCVYSRLWIIIISLWCLLAVCSICMFLLAWFICQLHVFRLLFYSCPCVSACTCICFKRPQCNFSIRDKFAWLDLTWHCPMYSNTSQQCRNIEHLRNDIGTIRYFDLNSPEMQVFRNSALYLQWRLCVGTQTSGEALWIPPPLKLQSETQ